MTAFSLRLTRRANAVSQLHARTADATWRGVAPREIIGITNGVHMPSWIGHAMGETLAGSLRADLDNLDAEGDRGQFWERLDKIPTDELWETHQRQKLELAIFARRRLRNQFARHGESPAVLDALECGPRPGHPDDRIRPPVRDLQAGRPAVQRHRSAGQAPLGREADRSRSSSPARPIPPIGRASR